MINTAQILSILEAVEKSVSSKDRFYCYGGCVRDLLLFREFNDIDILVCGALERVIERFSEITGYHCFNIGKKGSFYRCVAPDKKFFVDFQEGDLYEFLKSRDFTVNALAVRGDELPGFFSSKNAFHVVDIVDGLEDLKKGILRCVSKRCFDDDPIRLLRLVRYTIEIDFLPEETTLSLARKKADLILTEAKERINNEMDFLIKKDLRIALK